MSTEEQDAIQTTQIDGDVSVGRNVALGGGFISQGKGRVKGDLVVDGWLDAKNIKGVFKGIYLTVEKLKADFPEPEDGWWAIVGKTIPGPIYAADNGKWVATGEIGGQPTISGDEYYESLFEILQYLTEEFDAFTATKGMPNGLAPLDSETKIPATYLPSYVDDVIEFAKTVESVTVQPSAIDKSSTDSGCSVIYDKAKNVFVLSVTDSTGTKYYKDWNDSDIFGNENDIGILPQSGKVYVDNNENKTYRWSGTKLVVIGSDLSLGYTEATAFPGSDGKELQQTVALQEQAITSLTSTINSWDNKILNKLDKSVWDSIFILHREDEEDPTKITSIDVKANLWTNGEISAGGQREGGGGSAGGLIQTVYRYTQLNITLSDNDKTNTFNAYTIQQLANRIESLESTPSGISSLTINLGTVSYKGVGTSDVVVNLPAYPTTLPASDVYAWAKQPTKPAYTFSEIGSKPTTLSGYGISDAYTKTEADSRYARTAYDNNLINHTNEFNFIPSGYSSHIAINYRTQGGLNGSISQYRFYNGSGQLAAISVGGITINGYAALQNFHSVNEDLNTLVNSGVYRLESANINGPADSPNYSQMLVMRGYSDTIAQMIINYASADVYVRAGNPPAVGGNGTWTQWYTLARQLTSVDFTEIDTGSLQVYDSMSTRANRLCINWNGSYARVYAVSTDGGSLRTLWLGSTIESKALCYEASTGRWGIGTASPSETLHIVGGLRCNGWLRTEGAVGWYNPSYGGGIYMTDGTYVRVYNGKAFYVANNIVATGQVSAGNASDRRLKSNITTLTERETKHVLSYLNPVSFTWNAKAEELSGGDKKGIARSFVADEFLSLLPNAGRKMWDTYDAIYTEQAVPYLVKGWQMHERRLSDHERRIQELEKENRELKRQLRRVA